MTPNPHHKHMGYQMNPPKMSCHRMTTVRSSTGIHLLPCTRPPPPSQTTHPPPHNSNTTSMTQRTSMMSMSYRSMDVVQPPTHTPHVSTPPVSPPHAPPTQRPLRET